MFLEDNNTNHRVGLANAVPSTAFPSFSVIDLTLMECETLVLTWWLFGTSTTPVSCFALPQSRHQRGHLVKKLSCPFSHSSNLYHFYKCKTCQWGRNEQVNPAASQCRLFPWQVLVEPTSHLRWTSCLHQNVHSQEQNLESSHPKRIWDKIQFSRWILSNTINKVLG